MHEHIRLDELLSRNLQVHWSEGVALVRAICTQPAARDAFPAASQTHLSADGRVSFSGTSGGEGVAAAANLLAQMLSDDVPVRLRLVVTQATAGEHGYATLTELSEALEYFERPDGQNILRRLYERAALASSKEPSVAAAVDTLPPTVHAQPAESTPPRPRRAGRTTFVVGAGAAMACGTVWFFAIGSGGGAGRALAALKGFAASLSMGASAEPQPEVPSKNPPNPRTPARAGSAASGASPKGDNEVRKGTSRATHTESLEVVGLKGSRSVDLAVEPMSLVPRSFVTLGLSRAPEIAGFTKAGVPVFREPEPLIVIASTDEEDGPTGATGRIYSREDGEVTPPKSVYPRLPADSEVGLRTRGRTILEVVVSTQGLVERVALRSAPQNIHEFMLVSAAKAWQFEPATVEGRPVRFRHLISLTTPEKVAWVRRAR